MVELEEILMKCVWKQLAHSKNTSNGYGITRDDPNKNGLYKCKYGCDGLEHNDCYQHREIGRSKYEKD